MRLKGLQTVSTISKTLGVDRRTSINYIYLLRKAGHVKTSRGKGKIRIYEISENLVQGKGEDFYDYLNLHSRVKVAKPYDHIVHHKLTPEECIVKAITTKDFRTILSSLFLFRQVESWSRLYMFAKEAGVKKEVGALYDLARKYIRVRRMDGRIRNNLLEGKQPIRYIVPGMRGKDFHDIERTWNIYMPFNRSDMGRLKE